MTASRQRQGIAEGVLATARRAGMALAIAGGAILTTCAALEAAAAIPAVLC